jgi:hypothetical protein
MTRMQVKSQRLSALSSATAPAEDVLVMRIADEVERRVLRILRPEPVVQAARPIDADDCLTFKQAAHIVRKSDESVRRRSKQFDFTIIVGGATFISRRKLDAHLASHPGWRGGLDA